jgi:hypothetical protein
MVLYQYSYDGFVPVWYRHDADSGNSEKTSIHNKDTQFWVDNAFSTMLLFKEMYLGPHPQHFIFFVTYKWAQ